MKALTREQRDEIRKFWEYTIMEINKYEDLSTATNLILQAATVSEKLVSIPEMYKKISKEFKEIRNFDIISVLEENEIPILMKIDDVNFYLDEMTEDQFQLCIEEWKKADKQINDIKDQICQAFQKEHLDYMDDIKKFNYLIKKMEKLFHNL